MRISIVCHGNIARSQVLHHYLAEYAKRAGLSLDLFSCGTAPADAYPNAPALLAEVERGLRARGLETRVQRQVLDAAALQRLRDSDLILAADKARRDEILHRLEARAGAAQVMLFYEFIGEGYRDFVDTYDPERGSQDPVRFARCFDELKRIARLAITQLREDRTNDLAPPAGQSV
jgi:protein-tyrosine-phosphatase